MDDSRTLESDDPAAIGRIDDFLAELRKLVDRGMIAPEAFATVEAEKSAIRAGIERKIAYSDAIATARARLKTNPREALGFAEKARELDPDRPEGWDLSIAALGQIRDFAAAIDACRQAADRGHSAFLAKIAGFEDEKSRADRARAIDDALSRARLAALRGDHAEAYEACREAIGLAPNHVLALSMSVGALLAMGRIDDAEAARLTLRAFSPLEAGGWTERIRRARETHPARSTEEKFHAIDDLEIAPKPGKAEPAAAWPSFFGEFLEEHWQKLILGLAVLLIVVSSTVGASLVLGDQLWRGEGKCLLATVYTLMFAGFGRGLARWGAERAGRIMRLTTLVVLPLNFALVGELPGLGRASTLGLTVLIIDCAAMTSLAWLVSRSLGLSGGNGTPLALIAIGLITALTPRSATFEGGIAAMIAASVVFAASASHLGAWVARHREPDKAAGDDAPYFALGLLAFFDLIAVARIGGQVLHAHPSLYALPVMLASASTLLVADGLEAAGHPRRWLALLRLAGYALSALAFALGLAIPPGRGLVFTGNTLAVAIIGLFLYGRALWRSRSPAFLYASFSALFLAYFATQTFLHDAIFSHVEGTLSHLLGYGRKLPFPFKALNGLVLNAFLGILSLAFSRRWEEKKLAWHCHLIGLPLSIAACILSAFEPTAALLTMGGYTIAYALAVRVFAAPRVSYLACASFTGALLALSTRFGPSTAAEWSLAITSAAFLFWIVCRILDSRAVPIAYRSPIADSSRVLAVVSLVLAVSASWTPGWPAAGALWALAILYILIGLEVPVSTVATAAVSTAALASLMTIWLGFDRSGLRLGPAWASAWMAAVGAICQAIGASLKASSKSGSRIYPKPLFAVGLILAGLSGSLVVLKLAASGWGLSTADLLGIAAALGAISLSLAIASAWSFRSESLAMATVLTGSGGSIALMLAIASGLGWPPSPSLLGLSLGAASLMTAGLGDLIRDLESGWRALHRRALLSTTLLLVVLAWSIGGGAWWDSRSLAGTLALTALALAISVRQAPRRPMPDLALASGLAAWLVAWGSLGMRDFDGLPRIGLLTLLDVIAAFAVAEVVRRFATSTSTSARKSFAGAFPDFALVASTFSVVSAAFGIPAGEFGDSTGILALGAVVSIWLRRFRNEPGYVHVGLILAWLSLGSATRWALGITAPSILLGWLALVSSTFALALVGLRWPRRGWIDSPLRDVGLAIAISSIPMALAASVVSLDAYPMAVLALLLAIPTFAGSAVIDRSPWRVYGSTIAAVFAAYLTLFELGRGREGHISTLGVLASALAILFWLLGRGISRDSRADRRDVFAGPIESSTITLAILALPFEWDAIGPLVIASVPFFLLLRSRSQPGWLYPSLSLLVSASGFAISRRFGFIGLAPWSVSAGFACWSLGMAIGKRSAWRDRRLEFPAYHLAIVLGVAAIALQLDATVRLGEAWSSRPWLPAAIGALSLLMLKPFPHRGWLDGFVALLSLAILSAIAPGLESSTSWIFAGLAIALLWRIAERGSVFKEEIVCRRLGLDFEHPSRVFGFWSLGLLALVTLPLALRVGASAIGESSPIGLREWWTMTFAVMLFGANVDLSGRETPREWRRLGLHVSALLMAWWMAAPGSPIAARWGLDASVWIPIVSAALALLAVFSGTRAAGRMVAYYGLGLSLVAVLLTWGRPGSAATATLFLSTAASARLAIADRKSEVVGVASTLWGLAFLAASLWIFDLLGQGVPSTRASLVASGQALAAVGLVASGKRLRGRGISLKVVDSCAGVSLAIAVLAVLVSDVLILSPTLARANVAAMFAVGSVCVMLANRWSSIPLAFAAQASILLGYLAYRCGYAASPSGDSTAMLILAGIDLGIAEIAGRSQRRLFALPSLATGLALPLIAVGLAFRQGGMGDVPLFTLFAAGTFYAATCGRLRMKGLGYAAAVLYNAALWVLWSNFGWEFADSPQFYLVPVGFSTILFAEANRRELGHSQVNVIRCLGLTLIYFTLAMPIYRTASLGAWSLVLGLSLLSVFVGIGMRSQAFLWMGLSAFLLDVIYQLGRIGMEHALAKWAIMLSVGLGLVLFVALNEKKRLLATIRGAVDTVLGWD